MSVTGLFGYINKEIDFKKDITLLVGINGSGKTSLLNMLTWAIRPSIPHLCITEFSSLEVNFTYMNSEYSIICHHIPGKLEYIIKDYTNGKVYNPLTVQILISPDQISQDVNERTGYIEKYYGLAPDSHEKETWDFVKKLPDPTVIGLDRNLFTEESEQVFFDDSIQRRVYKKGNKSKASPMDRVKEIVNTEYRKSKNAILNKTSVLKNHLMLSAFDGSITLDTLANTSKKSKLTINQISTAEKRVNEFFQKYEQNTIWEKNQTSINKYFSQLKDITREYNKDPNKIEVRLIFEMNSNQFIKLKKLLGEFEKFERESNEILEKINVYLNTLNGFFKDSSKELLFKEDTSELVFNAIDQKGSVLKPYREISNLSSGEQQILILFSYLAFNSSDGKLFVIDEPELSLHIKWQEDFLEALEKITPYGTQIILATHSPILVGKMKSKAIPLFPYNK